MMLNNIFSIVLLRYFRSLAKLQLKKNSRALIVGITGSAGKTSARLAIAMILKARGRVKHSINANSETGIPLNILGISPLSYTKLDWLRMVFLAPIMLLINWEKFDYYVVEMGIDSTFYPKNMSYLLSILKPDVGLILNASLAHSAGFDSLVKDISPTRRIKKIIGKIASEKMKMVKAIPPYGLAAINLDQAEYRGELPHISARKITFGKSSKANLRITKVDNNSGFHMQFSYQGKSYDLYLTDILPLPYAYTFAGAIAVAAGLGIPVPQSILSLCSYRLPTGRSRILKGINGSTIIDSSYNASPSTMLESLKLLKKMGSHRHKLAIIGDMRELGTSEKQIHKELADWLSSNADSVILFGPLTLAYTLPVLRAKKSKVMHFEKMEDLIQYLKNAIPQSSVVLVKGSQNSILLERAVASLLKDPADKRLLCRRGPYWDKQRAISP